MQTARKRREFNFTHVYTGEPGKWLLITQVAMRNTVLGVGTLMPREKKEPVPLKSNMIFFITMNIILQMRTSVAPFEHQY